MTCYSPGPGQPVTPEEISRYLQTELRQISRAFASCPVEIQTFFAPPRGLNPNTLVIADGVEWNPGLGGGLYRWDGQIFLKIDETPVS
jgi:hypothetical protein